MRPLYYQGRLPRSGLCLLDIFIKPTSASFTPENRLVGVVDRPLGPCHCICQVKGAGMGAPVPGAQGVAFCRARRAQVPAVVPCRARGGQQVPGAGESWRRDAPESGGGWSVSFSAQTGESTLLVGGSGWWSGGPSYVSSPKPASGGSPRLESRDLERALLVSWAPRLGRAEDLSLPQVALFLTGKHVVACCL